MKEVGEGETRDGARGRGRRRGYTCMLHKTVSMIIIYIGFMLLQQKQDNRKPATSYCNIHSGVIISL